MILTESIHAGHEQVVMCTDTDADYTAVIAIHDTRLGPAVGGTRLRAYASMEDAVEDALRLSAAMTHKAALAGLKAGGGKAVILYPARLRSRRNLFLAHGRAINALAGRFVSGMDVGMVATDLDVMRETTAHLAMHSLTGGAGGEDTARGLVQAIRAAVRFTSGRTDLTGTTVAVQGAGNVGSAVSQRLGAAGACVLIGDIDEARARDAAASCGGRVVSAADIMTAEADVFAPCAYGSVLSPTTAQVIRARIVAGAANNQLTDPGVVALLAARGILYVPDFVANAGGVIGRTSEREGLPVDGIHARIDAIYETTLQVLTIAERGNISPLLAAERLANARLSQ